MRREACALLLIVSGLAAGQASETKPLLVSGSSTIYPLMVDIVQRFESLHPGVAIEVRSGGSGQG